MSIAEFSSGMRSHALQAFRKANVGKHKEINPLFYAISKNENVRKHEQEKGKTSFILSTSTINEIHDLLSKDFPDLPDSNTLFQRAKDIGNRYSKKIKINSVNKPDGSSEQVIVYEEIEFGKGIDNIIKEVFGEGTRGFIQGISGSYQKGHVVGLTTNLLEQSKEQQNGFDVKDTNILKAINLMIEDLKRYDIESSNFKSEDIYDVLGNYTKDPNKYLVELQIKKKNTESGRKVGADISEIRNILKDDWDGIKDTFADRLKSDTLFKSLLNMRGSPSMLELIRASILESLDPKQFPPTRKLFNADNINIARFTKKILIDKDRLRQSLLKEIAKLEQVKAKVIRDSKNRVRTQEGKFFSLTNIQILLRARLPEQIKKNMGTGLRKDILNLRSGRFAESAQIENLKLQKDNVIAIFYSYMKHPYATFEPGGKQGSPTSRNPVTLINKSIREIASSLVENRLRITRL